MRYWIDTEFLEDGRTIDMLSLGIVAEDGRMQYWQSVECDRTAANEWVRVNVLPHLVPCDCADDVDEPVLDVQHRSHCPWRQDGGAGLAQDTASPQEP